jgi:hypothetical protein
VADQDYGAVVVAQHVLQEVQRLDVEVVGGLVEDEEVGGPRHDAGERRRAFSPPDRDFRGARACDSSNRKSLR